MSIVLVQGDTRPTIYATLREQGGTTPINLTSCTVRFQMRRADDKVYAINGSCQIVDPVLGRVSYTLAANDLNNHGDFNAQFEVTYPDQSLQTTATPIPIKVRRQ